MKLEERPGHQGLLFGTSNGVLNYGAATVEVALNIGKRLANLSLEDADASSQADKDMINALVLEEMGSFGHIDQELREHIAAALKTCNIRVDADFAGMFRELGAERVEQAAITNVPL